MSQKTLTDPEYRKALREHAESLWALYLDALPMDAKFAAAVKARADAAFDLHFEFCKVESRHSGDLFREKRETVQVALRAKAY